MVTTYRCSMHYQLFPNDVQRCTFELAPYTYDVKHVEYVWRRETSVHWWPDFFVLTGSVFDVQHVDHGSGRATTNSGASKETFHMQFVLVQALTAISQFLLRSNDST